MKIKEKECQNGSGRYQLPKTKFSGEAYGRTPRRDGYRQGKVKGGGPDFLSFKKDNGGSGAVLRRRTQTGVS